MTEIRTQNLGYPRIGRRRELKRAVESYWNGESSEAELLQAAADLRKHHWQIQRDAGIDRIPSNDFSLYDQVLDMSSLLGNVPERFEWDGESVSLELYFRMARGSSSGIAENSCCSKVPELACEMTKWFDTNYHYLVPEFNEKTCFRISSPKVFDEFMEARELGFDTTPVLIGPLTYLFLGKEVGASEGFDRFDLAETLVIAYTAVLKGLASIGARHVRLDEPAFALDLEERHLELARSAYAEFRKAVPAINIEVATYFGSIGDNLPTFLDLPVAGFHIDCVRGGDELPAISKHLADTRQDLSLGVIDGRNIWKADLKGLLKRVQPVVEKIGSDRILFAPSCSLLHVPVSVDQETELDSELQDWLSFADEKLRELSMLRDGLAGKTGAREQILENGEALQKRRRSRKVNRPEVQARFAALREEQFHRESSFPTRNALQKERLCLPDYPTTTIGSFPQTAELRKVRARFRKGEWTKSQYDTFLRLRTEDCIRLQEKIGLDVLVHGEFERNDMVEYFGEQLDGFLFTRNGWVQSYGSRCVKPPIIFGDVLRNGPMTVEWAKFAQAKTEKPMKGMLTGPVTILQWSFVRDDQPRRDTAYQIALAIRDEVEDLEAAGLPIVQIDEAAIREGMPLRKSHRPSYLDWAVRSFRLASSGVKDSTQIHTHMCYSEFTDMLEAIVAMDADVITIENARSGHELLRSFADFEYPNEIGPGVYDIHSPRIPTEAEMRLLLEYASSVIPAERLWVNPDCGLKTRSWKDVTPSLERMVSVARSLRKPTTVPATVGGQS